MATYKEIHGVKVQYRDSDATAIDGDVWYNRTSRLLKMYATSGSWASGTDLNTSRGQGGGVGPATNNICFTGKPDGTATWLTQTEAYNGSTWTEVADLSAGQANFMCGGSAESAIVAGGEPGHQTNCEEWDASSWTAGGGLNTGRDTLRGFGAASTAAIAAGGQVPSVTTSTESYDGSSWTEVGALNVAKNKHMGLGTATAGLILGGNNGPSTAVEEWNGTGWTEVNDLNTARETGGNSSYGTATAGMTSGGSPAPAGVNTEQYNGTSWTEVGNNSAHGLGHAHGGGSSTSAILAGGVTYINTVEEWDESAKAETIAFD